MSLWRKEASARLPELQKLIASRQVDNPMMLHIELHLKFEQLCRQKVPPLDLIKRIWEYARWCANHEDQGVLTAAAYGFCEHLIDDEACRRILPQIMSIGDYVSLKPTLLYHNSEEEYAEVLKLFENKAQSKAPVRSRPRK